MKMRFSPASHATIASLATALWSSLITRWSNTGAALELNSKGLKNPCCCRAERSPDRLASAFSAKILLDDYRAETNCESTALASPISGNSTGYVQDAFLG